MKLWVLGIVALGASVGVARSEFLYKFDVNNVNGIQPFSLSFTSPTLIGDGISLNFAPLSVTDGTDVWTIVRGSAEQPCFDFGTTAAVLAKCGSDVPQLPLAGAFYVAMSSGAFPNSTGTYSFSGQVTLIDSSTNLIVEPFTGNLSVSSSPTVPEPASIALASVALLAVYGTFYVRRGNRC